MDLFEALYTTRAMRRMKQDPIPGEVVRQIFDAAVRSPSGGNSQNWRFVAVTDRVTVARLGEFYLEAWEILLSTVYATRRGDEQTERMLNSSQWLAEHFEEVPLVVMAFHRNDPAGASIYPAVWSLQLAARGLGIGSTLTTILGQFRHQEVADLLGVPLDKGWTNAAAVPLGYPLGRWGVAQRRPAHEVVQANHWGKPPSWTVEQPLWP